MNIAFVGCGYVAEFYAKTLPNYPDLKLIAAFDHDRSNLEIFCRRWGVTAVDSLQQLLGRNDVDTVINLTNPRSHFDVTKKALEAGKHVYSEKPLAMDFPNARELADLAKARGLYLSSAPCSVLSETAHTLWKALRENVIGQVRLVYGNFDDGMIAPNMSPWLWRNESGVAWPAKDEFEVGCTYEHAGYLLTWLAAFFGPALSVTSFAKCLLPDKGIAVDRMAPDFVVGCIEYGEGIVARLTCSLVAPKDKSLTIIGDKGVLSVSDVRNDVGPVYLRRMPVRGLRGAIERRVNSFGKHWRILRDWKSMETLPVSRRRGHLLVGQGKPVDFCRGLAEVSAAIREKRAPRLTAELGTHLVELIEALQYPQETGGARRMTSRFDPILPLP
jgi:predicted dehydrogenase